MSRVIVLLRGVNVGGARKLAMADLRAMAADIGLGDPETLLQSGNLVVDDPEDRPIVDLEALLEREAAARLGLETAFILRRLEAWAEALAANPFAEAAQAAPAKLIVMFLKRPVDAAALAAAEALVKGPERIAHEADRLYIHYPDGQGRSKLTTAALERALGTPLTGRNWNTLLKLDALARR